jgi:hypothetical protein
MGQDPDTCRVHDIDGTPVRLHGGTGEPLTEEDRAAFRALIDACRRRYARDRGWRVLTVDLSNTSAFVTDLDGHTVVGWSGVTRRTALLRAESAGWVPMCDWEYTSPADGFWCYVATSDLP